MNTCKECKWWKSPPRYFLKEDKSWGQCTCPRIYPNCDSFDINRLAEAGGAEGYGDTFTTHESFGCILWEKQEV